MIVLALETTADLCSIAIHDDRGILVERAFRHRMYLSVRLVGDVEALLSDAGLKLGDVDGFGVGIGPGSFTGVRIAVTTVKAWASVLDKPVAGISSLDALAYRWVAATERVVVPMVRARPGSVYAAEYLGGDPMPGESTRVDILSVAELTDRLQADVTARFLLCGEAAELYRAELQLLGERIAFARPEQPSATSVAELATLRIAAGRADDPLALIPLYIAPPPIGGPAASGPGSSATGRSPCR